MTKYLRLLLFLLVGVFFFTSSTNWFKGDLNVEQYSFLTIIIVHLAVCIITFNRKIWKLLVANIVFMSLTMITAYYAIFYSENTMVDINKLVILTTFYILILIISQLKRDDFGFILFFVLLFISISFLTNIFIEEYILRSIELWVDLLIVTIYLTPSVVFGISNYSIILD